jgi:hypothetical protein
MTFNEVIDHLLEGKKITRRGWNDPELYIYLTDFVMYHDHSGDHRLLTSRADLIATDWEVI